jgi:hypothetical protein
MLRLRLRKRRHEEPENRGLLDEPFVRFPNHVNDLPHYLIIGRIQIMTCLVIQIPTPSGELNPDLCFTGFAFRIAQFGNELRMAASFTFPDCNVKKSQLNLHKQIEM